MLDGVILLWSILSALSLLFVVVDIRSTPAPAVLKWGFVLLTAYTGPLGAFLYVLGCREPLPGLHERYVASRWRQVLGSTMHCVAGDGVGILVGAVIASVLRLHKAADIALEYGLGFAFGWTVFQSLFMRGMKGGSYKKALASTFFPELLSMNCLMAGMVPAMMVGMKLAPSSHEPSAPAFWFIMSMALLAGFITAYPMNWWLVSRHMKHGMMTERSPRDSASAGAHRNAHDDHVSGDSADPKKKENEPSTAKSVSNVTLAWVTAGSFVIFGIGLSMAVLFGDL